MLETYWSPADWPKKWLKTKLHGTFEVAVADVTNTHSTRCSDCVGFTSVKKA